MRINYGDNRNGQGLEEPKEEEGSPAPIVEKKEEKEIVTEVAKVSKEKAEKAKQEKAKLDKEKAEQARKDKIEQDKREKLEQQKREKAEQEKKERLEKEKRDKAEKAQKEKAEKAEREKAEKAKAEAEKKELEIARICNNLTISLVKMGLNKLPKASFDLCAAVGDAVAGNLGNYKEEEK